MLWHVDNEYACHVSECFCGASAEAFRAWLRERYETLEVLNGTWGTAFWGQVYGDWLEVHPPKRAPSFLNPGQELDWRRFRRPWMLMEQATSYVNWRHRNAAKRPGVMRLGSYQALARGANAVMFFQWRASDGQHFGTTLWSDLIEVGEAEVLARFDQDLFAGSPAVTLNRAGNGAAYYVGTNLDSDGWAWLLDLACQAAGVSAVGGDLRASGPLEFVERRDGPDRWLFALNHGTSPVQLGLDQPALDAISGARLEHSVRVGPMDLAILRSAR